MPHYVSTDDLRARDLRFVTRISRMRLLGTVLCALPIASVLEEQDAVAMLWMLLGLNAFAWPVVAYALSRRARDPVAMEYRCLMLDSAFGGGWIAVMQVSAAPTAIFITMLTADKIAAGGWPLAWRSTLMLILGFLTVWATLGFPFQPSESLRTHLASFAFLFIYSVVLAILTHRLTRRIARQNRMLERANRIDPIMQVPNRQHLEDRALIEMARFQRSGRPSTLVLIDIDHFKQINDHFGHGMGDVVLKRVADLLRSSVRDVDLPARYGGDEFALLLVDTNEAAARIVAERIGQEACVLAFDEEPGLRCSLSIGLAEISRPYENIDQWVRAADAALYRAKAAGRNRIGTA
jgi:diguanylate cyclase